MQHQSALLHTLRLVEFKRVGTADIGARPQRGVRQKGGAPIASDHLSAAEADEAVEVGHEEREGDGEQQPRQRDQGPAQLTPRWFHSQIETTCLPECPIWASPVAGSLGAQERRDAGVL